MKTAISLPDEVFAGAEHLAKRLRLTRSELYSRALKEYVARHSDNEVTEALDSVCAGLDEGPNAFVSSASRRMLERIEW